MFHATKKTVLGVQTKFSIEIVPENLSNKTLSSKAWSKTSLSITFILGLNFGRILKSCITIINQ